MVIAFYFLKEHPFELGWKIFKKWNVNKFKRLVIHIRKISEVANLLKIIYFPLIQWLRNNFIEYFNFVKIHISILINNLDKNKVKKNMLN